jgi:phenylpropionate dioxygenase-like ring-hydroxylating dioxygenase large terminal subunit
MKQLQGAPWLLAHRSMLKPNRPMKISLLGNDYVLWQDSHGTVNALPNACPHMGAMLSEGWCVTKSDGSSAIACPFHALEFDASGHTILPGSNKQTQYTPQKIKLNNEVGMDWVRRNFESFPAVVKPNLSR